MSEKEFFIACKTSQGDYKTLIHVRVPLNPSGIVLVEPWHPNGTWTVYAKVDGYETRSGESPYPLLVSSSEATPGKICSHFV